MVDHGQINSWLIAGEIIIHGLWQWLIVVMKHKCFPTKQTWSFVWHESPRIVWIWLILLHVMNNGISLTFLLPPRASQQGQTFSGAERCCSHDGYRTSKTLGMSSSKDCGAWRMMCENPCANVRVYAIKYNYYIIVHYCHILWCYIVLLCLIIVCIASYVCVYI